MKFKAGKYYIGDPCYIFDQSWNQVLDETDFFNKEPQELFGDQICCGSTAYGDGEYKDNLGNSYYVDAGLIGILPVSLLLIDLKYTEEQVIQEEGMHIHEFKEDFEVEIDHGIFHFGSIVINTRDEENEEEEFFL